jgi:hypothetical protein
MSSDSIIPSLYFCVAIMEGWRWVEFAAVSCFGVVCLDLFVAASDRTD